MPDPALLPTEPVPRLLAIMAQLRGPEGCPWDREQTPASIKSQMLEEVYEVFEAIDSNDAKHLREELGDVLLHLVFQSQMAAETGAFTFNDVAATVSEKLIRRHPHVFSVEQGKYNSAGEIVEVWNRIKKVEKSERTSVLEGIPAQLPALLRAENLQRKAKTVGFDWPDHHGGLAKVKEELEEVVVELDAAQAPGKTFPPVAGSTERARLEDELGDLLFSVVNLTRHLKLHAEELLAKANGKFERRFQAVEKHFHKLGKPMKEATLAELDQAWNEVKRGG